MKSVLVTALLMFFFITVAQANRATYGLKSANYGSHPGDMGSLYQHNRGFFYSIMNNDYLGNTDKLMTSKSLMGLAYTGRWYSISISSHWRLVTPIVKHRHGEEALEPHIGVFAEWSQSTISQAFNLGIFKLQLKYAYNSMRNYGLASLQQRVHKAIGSHVEEGTYQNQIRDHFHSWGGEFGTVLPIGSSAGLYLAGGFNDSQFIEDRYFQTNLLLAPSRNFSLSLEYKRIYQKGSMYYGVLENSSRLTRYRDEAGLGIKLFDYWRIAFRYVSAYLEDDKYQQIYFDPISINIKF